VIGNNVIVVRGRVKIPSPITPKPGSDLIDRLFYSRELGRQPKKA